MSTPYATHEQPKDATKILARIEASTTRQRLRGATVYRVDAYHPRVRRDGYRILHLSDIHFNGKTPQERLARLCAALDETYDLIVLTGDILDKGDCWSEEELAFLRQLRSRDGKLAVLGNHDFGFGDGGKRAREFLRKAGFFDLTNKNVRIAGMRFVGLDDALFGKPDSKKAFRGVRHDEFVVLLLHNLDALTDEAPPCIDLVLWGHLHAGEIRIGTLDSVDVLLFNKDFFNLNGHRRERWRFLTPRTLSYLHPGLQATIKKHFLIPRFNVDKEGVSVLTLKKYK